ncbi:uncharacterized protein LOC129570322 [Sitodiplosis mosellana]|uniref:uncharacterized protein LOC129570322 n=1 Tax=Sitodiplosis mosellana TaxID=263140 RepID=UPI002443C0CA|nr:uncharacterized protein LOC129570322 [Sitodiplosis mosellana]
MQLQHDFDVQMKRKQPFKVRPADSWKQPSENIDQPPTHDLDNVEQTSEIFTLNEDCLLRVCKFLDLDSLVNLADVCKMFKRLLDERCFPLIRTFKFINQNKYDCNNNYDPLLFSTTLVKMRRALRCIGPYITDLTVESNWDDLVYGLQDTMFAHDIVTRFLEVLRDNIGTNVRTARLSGFFISEDRRIAIVAPILRGLEVLVFGSYLMGYAAYTHKIDFQTMCPDLIDFELKGNVTMPQCDKPWKNLRRFAVIESILHDYRHELQLYFQWNLQLTCLEFVAANEKKRFTPLMMAVKHLRMVEKISISSSVEDEFDDPINSQDINSLHAFQYLTEISLIDLHHEHLKSIVECLATFDGLRKIHLERFNGGDIEGEQYYEQSLVVLAKQFPHLEHFRLHRVTISQVNLIEFVRFASQWKSLTLDHCKINFSDELIQKLANVLECNRQKPSNALLLELGQANRREDEFKHLTEIESESVRQYLQIKSKFYEHDCDSPLCPWCNVPVF